MTPHENSASQPYASGSGPTPWEPPAPAHLQALLTGYEVFEMIGCGGMGAVYKAEQISLGRPVAIKILPALLLDGQNDFAQRFRNEARLMAQLSHPGMIAVHDFGQMRDGQLYFVMEFIEGTDVARMIAQEGRLPPMQAMAITAHVCDALKYAHEHGIIHSDIKPANVMVSKDGHVKVADFGLAKIATQDSAHSTHTMGTPEYVAPESLMIGVREDARVDLYSLGVMLYEMLTGKVPQGAFLPASRCAPGIDLRFDQIVARAMQHDREKRYQTAAQFRADLDRILAVPVEQSRPAPTRTPASIGPRASAAHLPPPPKRGTPWPLYYAAVAAIGVGIYFWLQQHPKPAASGKPKVAETAPKTSEPATVAATPETKPAPDPAPAPSTPEAPALPIPEPKVAKSEPSPFPSPVPVSPAPMPAPAPVAPKPETDVTRRLSELEAQFKAALDRDVTKPRAAAMADLDLKYTVALDRELATVTSAGNSQGAIDLREERKRVESHQIPPGDDQGILPDAVKGLRTKYVETRSKIDADFGKTAGGLTERYAQLLRAYQAELTRAGRLDDALEVSVRIKDTSLSRLAALTGVGGVIEDDGIEMVTDAAKRANTTTADGIILRGSQKFVTTETFKPPLEINIVAKTDQYNLRMGYAAFQVIFNWEREPTELRIDGGPASGKHRRGAGGLPPNKFVKIKWVVTPGYQRIYVDGERRYEHRGDYSKLDQAISVFPTGSIVTLQSLKVKKLQMVEGSASPEITALLSRDEPWTGDITLPAGTYRPMHRVMLGNPDKGAGAGENTSHAAMVTTGPGTVVDDANLFLNLHSTWKADGALFRDCRIGCEMTASFEAKNSLFQSCSLRKDGVWWVDYFSSKWSFTNCAFSKEFFFGWKVVDVGMRVQNCTFYGVDFPRLIYQKDVAAEVVKDWLVIKNCRFVNCKIPESLVIATKDCLFEDCEFGALDERLNILTPTPVQAVIYSTKPSLVPATGPNRTVEVRDAKSIPQPAGATMSYRIVGSTLSF